MKCAKNEEIKTILLSFKDGIAVDSQNTKINEKPRRSLVLPSIRTNLTKLYEVAVGKIYSPGGATPTVASKRDDIKLTK